MDEAEWLSFADPSLMLQSLQGEAPDLKLRLFGIVVHSRPLAMADTHFRVSQKGGLRPRITVHGYLGTDEMTAKTDASASTTPSKHPIDKLRPGRAWSAHHAVQARSPAP